MPDENNVQTGWVIAATEGSTVDGRTITNQWIKEMAETYSVDEYTAVIWPEHFRSSWAPFDGNNWGTVDEVKAAKKGGKLRLFVKLTANSFLLDANQNGQKLFMSIEPNTDFAGTGKCYLQGLAVTDSPASTGTTRLKFSMGDHEIEHDYSQLEVLQRSDFMFADCEPNQAVQAKSLITQLVNLFSTNNPSTQATDTPDNAEEETMKQEQFDALIGKIDGVKSQVNNLETETSKKFGELDTKFEKFNVSAEPNEESDDDGDKDLSVTAQQFSQLNTSITGLVEKVDDIETKFNKLSQEQDGQEPDPAGQGESVSLV